MRERYLGLDLSGAKNPKTALSILEYYPKERKVFLLDIQDRIHAPATPSRESSGNSGPFPADQWLLGLIRESAEELACLAVNVPLTLPPCFLGSRLESICIRWMTRQARRASKRRQTGSVEFTAYTQRPVELWIRHQVLSALPKTMQFEVDEAFGGSRAPLTARMHFLQRHLDRKRLIESWPKLTALRLCLQLGHDRRFLSRYRKLEEGAHARMLFLEHLIEEKGVFIYEKDLRKLSQSLAAFDSFLCAYTGLLARLGLCERPPRGFPLASGWVHFPREH